MAKRGPKPRQKLPMADPLTGAPEKPEWLDAEASAEWDRLIAILTERRVISKADGMALALLCSTYSAWRSAAEALAKEGPAVETGSGGFKPSPELQAADRHRKQPLSWLREFGLTPASRHTVPPIVDVAKDSLEAFLETNHGRRDDPLADLIRLSP